MTNRRYIISGGGTGGHIYPALSIAHALKEKDPACDILFVGAEGRMEMEKVPAAGYEIKGLPVMGLPRKPSVKLFTFVLKFMKSRKRARKIIKDFAPDVVIGVGGYASAPTLKMAAKMGIPTLLQEQNSYAGITNRYLAKQAHKICVAYDNMEQFFPENKIVFTGNPIRKGLAASANKGEARKHFGVTSDKPVVLILGGSLGARSINNGLLKSLGQIEKTDVEFIWQTGKYYYCEIVEKTTNICPANLHITEFIARMDLAYGLADLVVTRAGAGTISELCVIGKPAILVPSPNVAEDHQTKNAQALVDKKAGLLIKDNEVDQSLVETAIKTVNNTQLLSELGKNIAQWGKPHAAETIAMIIMEMGD